ncbi:hypothetical protein M5689_010443 [Euphorbia peplus]|nr:hypothetical protein M5689_010443 [Euphorbia peplus]
MDGNIPKLLVFHIDTSFHEVFNIRPELLNLRHGLILFDEDFCTLGVWNPFTRSCKKLPVLPREDHVSIRGLVFGYDCYSDDYKVLLIKEVGARTEATNSYGIEIEVWILGLRSSCCWRNIKTFWYDEYRVSNYPKNCFVDGAFYFHCDDEVMLVFDVATETFS